MSAKTKRNNKYTGVAKNDRNDGERERNNGKDCRIGRGEKSSSRTTRIITSNVKC